MYGVPSLEELLTVDFGLYNPMPLQRAICRIADGQKLGDLYNHPDIVEAIGPFNGFSRCVPTTMLLLCAIRGGKSLIAAAAGVRCGLTCDTSVCGPGDVPRVGILSTRRDEAKVVMDHLLGAFRTSARLADLLVKEPAGDSIFFRHPTGRPIEIKVVAGARAGSSLVARFMAAVVFDECAKMVGQEDGVVNLDDARHAVAGRLLKTECAHEWLISSPWAPFGPVYQETLDHWKKPSGSMVVVRARGDMLNPVWWTPERILKLERDNPDAHKTDFLAEFADPDAALIPGVHLDAATRKTPLQILPDCPPELDQYSYAAEIDPATRGNAWALVVTKKVGPKTVVVLAKEWKGTKVKPLSSKDTLAEIATLLKPYKTDHSPEGRKRVGTDQFAVDQLKEMGKEIGLDLVEFPSTRPTNDDGYMELARRFEMGQVEVPAEVNLLSDLRRLRRVVTAGSYHVDLPISSDGRHCDFAPPLMRACQRNTHQPSIPDPRPQWKQEQDKSLETARKKYAPNRNKPWWMRSG